MTTIDAKQFEEICNDVWRDRSNVLIGRGVLTGEAALVRAVYWRLCKAGIKPAGGAGEYGLPQTVHSYELGVTDLLELNASPQFNCAPLLQELVEHYQQEVARS
jgi:hypothetical protein